LNTFCSFWSSIVVLKHWSLNSSLCEFMFYLSRNTKLFGLTVYQMARILFRDICNSFQSCHLYQNQVSSYHVIISLYTISVYHFKRNEGLIWYSFFDYISKTFWV
jgi:hypothetical protein